MRGCCCFLERSKDAECQVGSMEFSTFPFAEQAKAKPLTVFCDDDVTTINIPKQHLTPSLY